MNKKFNFTKAVINTLPLPEKGKRAYYYDEKEAGLVLDVRASGTKSFYLYKKIEGKPERILLGAFPDISIENARKIAAIKKGEIANGRNPQSEKRKVRQETTFGDFFIEYLERYSKPQKKSWIYDEREVNKFLPQWFKRKLSSIKKHEVSKLHDEIGRKNGIYQANRILERVRGIYSKAIEWGWEGDNPATGLKKFKEKKRDRFLQPNEMPLLFQALSVEENETAKDYILLSLMTGARKSNMLAMRWNEIDMDLKKWRIPDTKNGEPVTIPLIPQAIDILKRRKALTNSPWVFEGEGNKGHFADPKKPWDRIRQRATLALWKQNPKLEDFIDDVKYRLKSKDNYGFTILKLFNTVQKEAAEKGIELPIGLIDVRLHDLRRTFGSYQAITGASLHIIGETLGHKNAATTAVYARLHDDPTRAAIEKGVGMMFQSFGEQ